MNGILVIGHGSRSKDAYDTFYKIVDSLKVKTGEEVEGCFMEISPPYIPEIIDKMYEKGVSSITILPYFLYEGIHIKEDIPEILERVRSKYPEIEFKIAKPLGYHDLLIDILIERIEGEKTCI